MKLYLCVSACLLLVAFCTAVTPAAAQYWDCPEQASGAWVRPENRYFDVLPRIVPADKESVIDLVPLFDHCRPKPDCTYELVYTPTEHLALKSGWVPDAKSIVVPVDGKYQFRMFFEGEQAHVLYVEEISKDKRRLLGDFRLYSLRDDLRALRPFKGDFHMHSCRSDGVESPAYVTGACRRVGFDFMALTDHRNYAASLEAKAAYDGVPIDLRVYPGEEVHSPDNPVHIVSFGANAGVTELYRDDETAYRAEVAKIQEGLTDLPAAVDPFQYAASLWVFDRIRERGGMGMFCHVYWFTKHKYYISEALASHLFDTQPFDALELISGNDRETLIDVDANALQLARYHEERAKGRNIPICGISDAHGCEKSETFGRYYTVCFAPSAELADIIASIKGMNSVAVEAVAGHMPRAYGPFRLSRFTQFLLSEIFPQHDELCFEEGRLMLQYASGDKSAVERLRLLQGQVARLYGRYWAE